MLLACMVGVAFSTILVGIANQTNVTMNKQNFAPGVTFGAVSAVGSFSGTQWAQIWATQWLETCIFAVYLCIFVTLAGDPAVAGALLGPMIIFNSLSISVDTADAGFQFFWYSRESRTRTSSLGGGAEARNEPTRDALAELAQPLTRILRPATTSAICEPPDPQRTPKNMLVAMWHSSELVRSIMFGTLSTRIGMHVGVHFLWFVVEVALFFAAHQVVLRRQAAAAAAKAAKEAAAAAPPAQAVVAAAADEAPKA